MTSEARRSRRFPRVAGYLLIVSVLASGIVAIAANAEHWQYSRNLDCGKQIDTRVHAICSSIESHLEYTCCGHAIIHPEFRPTWTTVAAVWCEQRIGPEDAQTLRALSSASDWRLAQAAEDLFRLLTGRDRYGVAEPENNIFHPANPSYLLKNGCSRDPKR